MRAMRAMCSSANWKITAHQRKETREDKLSVSLVAGMLQSVMRHMQASLEGAQLHCKCYFR
jgi:hypothetical protein